MVNKLVEISRSDLPKLQDLYLRDWPENIIGFYTLNNFIIWSNIDPNIKNLSFYSLNGEWNDGTFLIVVSIILSSEIVDGYIITNYNSFAL